MNILMNTKIRKQLKEILQKIFIKGENPSLINIEYSMARDFVDMIQRELPFVDLKEDDIGIFNVSKRDFIVVGFKANPWGVFFEIEVNSKTLFWIDLEDAFITGYFEILDRLYEFEQKLPRWIEEKQKEQEEEFKNYLVKLSEEYNFLKDYLIQELEKEV